MSKERIRRGQFANVDTVEVADLALSPEQIADLKGLYEGTLDRLKPGKLVAGKIVKIDEDGVLVDIDYKSQGLVPRYEFTQHELKNLKMGDELETLLDELENLSGNVTLSYEKAKALKAWDSLLKLFEENKPVEGLVTHKVKGGLNVDIGVPAFLPGSQVDLQRVTDFDNFVGQKISAYILKVNKKRGNVIISRRKYLHDQRSESRKEILDRLDAGSIIQGVVKNITNYGVFIDIGGVDGLLHITDMTWGRIAHPSELVKIGEKITVKVLSFDRDNEKISLGLKQLEENPWQKVADSIQVGQKIKGKISSITDYGLFVEIAKGVEGLVHISEVSWKNRIDDLRKHYRVGDEIETVIVSIDPENRRMSLSIKKLESNPWENVAQQFKEAQRIKGKITNITDFGIFVELLPGIDGLVHVSDLSWTEHVAHPSDKYKIGQEVEAVILNIDPEKQKVSLGIKQIESNPWDSIEKELPVGATVEGVVAKIANFGAFVKLPSGIEGLIRTSELPEGKALEDVLKVGDTMKFRVAKVNKEEQKLALSLREPSEQKPERERSEKPKKEAQAPVEQKETQAKAKSQFQLELERITGRSED
jgi:small subunit ribosomal protein S1